VVGVTLSSLAASDMWTTTTFHLTAGEKDRETIEHVLDVTPTAARSRVPSRIA